MSAAIAAQPTSRTECITVRGEELLAKVRELIHQGNVRRIVVISEDRRSILEFPLTAGVNGAAVAPALVAIGAIAALAKSYTLLVEAVPQMARAGMGSAVALPPSKGYTSPKRTATV
jgi:CBS domain-containing protein